MMLQEAAGADGSHKLRIRVDCEPDQVGVHPDIFSQLLELVSEKVALAEQDEAGVGGGGSFASPVEVAIGKSFGTADGKRRNRGKKTQVRATTRDGGVGGGHKRSFGDKDTASDGSIRTYWLQMEDYFRQVTPQDVRLLRPLTNLILTPEGDVSDPCLAIPPLGGHYLENWAKEDGAEADRTAEALAQQSVTRVKRKILAASPVSKKRKIPVSADAKVITTVISPPENDDEELCHVCNGGDSEQWNQILFCDSCDVAVHQDCYGVREVPEGEWLCTWCSHRSKHFRRAPPQLRKPSASEGLHADLASVQNGPPDCLLCPVRGGALKPVADGDSNGSIRASAKLRFAHLFCCQWVPETFIHNMEAMEPIKNVEGVREERWKLLCAVCKEKHGACIQCSHGMCATAFHPLCAREAKLRMEVSSREDSEDVDLRAYCQKHSSTRGGKSIASGTEIHGYAEAENQGLADAQSIVAGNVAGKSAEGNPSSTTQKIEGNLLPADHDGTGAPSGGKSIGKLLQGEDHTLLSCPVLETSGVQLEVSHHDVSICCEAAGQVCEGGFDQSSKSSSINDTSTILKGKNGLQIGPLSHSGSDKLAECVIKSEIIVPDSPLRDQVACVENTHVIEESYDPLMSDQGARKSQGESAAVGSIKKELETGAENHLSLNEERRQRGLRGDASTSEAGSPAFQNTTTSDLPQAFEKEKRGSLCESQGANLHLAGTVKGGSVLSSQTGEQQSLLGSGRVRKSNQRTGSKLEDMSTDGKDFSESQENSTHVGTNADSCPDISASKNLLLKGSARTATGMCIDSIGKDDASPDMQHAKHDQEFAAFMPEAELDVHPGGSKTETRLHTGPGTRGVATGSSQNSVIGAESETLGRSSQTLGRSSQPRLRIKIGGDSMSRSMPSVHEPGFNAKLEDGKAVDVPIQNLHQISNAAFNSQWPEEVRSHAEVVQSHPHPFVLKKLEKLQRIHNDVKVMTSACEHDALKLETASIIVQGPEADQSILPLHGDPNFVVPASLPKDKELQGIMSPEGYVCGDESKPGNGIVLAATKSSEGDLDSLDAQWKQLNEAKRLGLFDLSPEDEIVGEILILQDKLIDCTQANSINCDTLIKKLLSLLPEERQIEQKNVQDLAIVRQFQTMAKEAKKLGRKEKKDKEAQAILAAATAAAAASPRVGYMRRDNLGREDFMSPSADASLDSGGSQSFTPPAFASSASAVLRTLKPPVPKPPKLMLSAGRPASRSGIHVKGTTSKISVAKATSAKSGFYRENSGYYLEEAPLCSVCGGGESVRPNKIVCCDRCKVAVHQECYGVGRVPLSTWFCQPCAEMQRLYQNLKPPEVDATGRLGPGVQCAICPGRIGAFKRTSDGRWAHVFCAQWLPETAAGKDQTATIEGLAELKQRGGSDEMQVLRQLRVEFERVRLICERIVRREKVKRELLHNMKDIGISQLRVATVSHNLPAHFDQNVDGYQMIQGPPGTGSGGPDEMCWTEGSVPSQRATSNKPAHGGTVQVQSDERKKHKRQRRQAEPLHSEKLMTPVEASMQNLRLPKGYAYVPVDTVPVPHQNSTDKQHPPA